jgi:hypothetical protein
MAADIIKFDLTDVQNTLQGVFQMPFELTSYDDGGTIDVGSGRVEMIGGYPFRVEGGDLEITDSGVAAGNVYVLIRDEGDDTAVAYLSTKAGVWNPNLGGYYIDDGSADDGAKVLFKMIKEASPTSYTYRSRMWTGDEVNKARENKITAETHHNLQNRLDSDYEDMIEYALIL